MLEDSLEYFLLTVFRILYHISVCLGTGKTTQRKRNSVCHYITFHFLCPLFADCSNRGLGSLGDRLLKATFLDFSWKNEIVSLNTGSFF